MWPNRHAQGQPHERHSISTVRCWEPSQHLLSHCHELCYYVVLQSSAMAVCLPVAPSGFRSGQFQCAWLSDFSADSLYWVCRASEKCMVSAKSIWDLEGTFYLLFPWSNTKTFCRTAKPLTGNLLSCIISPEYKWPFCSWTQRIFSQHSKSIVTSLPTQGPPLVVRLGQYVMCFLNLVSGHEKITFLINSP